MNRFNDNIGHKFGSSYDTGRQLNIKRLLNYQDNDHKPMLDTNKCFHLTHNPYTDYHAHCAVYTKKDNKVCQCLEEEPMEHTEPMEHKHMEEEEDNTHIHIETIYVEPVFHNFNVCEEREKMKRDLQKSKSKVKISIKDFLKK